MQVFEKTVSLIGSEDILNNCLCYIFSSKNKSNFKHVNENIGIFAENGIWNRLNDGNWIKNISASNEHLNSSWNEQLFNILQYYSYRVPSSEIEINEVY